MARNSPPATPPRAPLAFRVGVVGHRPDRLPTDVAGLARLRVRIAETLEAVALQVKAFAQSADGRLYDQSSPPVLTAVAPLAEGADRMFAEEALHLGYRLTCVMPFHREEFERDFIPPGSLEADSARRFAVILDRAAAAGGLTRFELDGRRSLAHEAYDAAGRVVLNQSDLLVVVWDGGAAAGVGGTLHTLHHAVASGVPTLWIDSRSPNGWRAIRSVEELDELTEQMPAPLQTEGAAADLISFLSEVVIDELAPGAAEADLLAAYQAETCPRFNFAFTWKMFRDFMATGFIRMPAIRVADFVKQIRDAWPVKGDPTEAAAIVEPGTSWINACLRNHYAWSDKLADIYADRHRSGFVAGSLLAATTVFTALLPVAGNFHHTGAIATAVVEAVILVIMLSVPMFARRGRWHQKWLEYRVLAERIRELRILIPFGSARARPRIAAHLSSYGDPERSWMSWYARAIARSVGLPEARIDAAYVAERRRESLDFLGSSSPSRGQIGFHHMNCERMERIHERLHRMSLILFSATMLAVVANWLIRYRWPDNPPPTTDWLILFSAFLPALGAALAAINNQGEFARLQRRSNAMVHSLATLRAELAATTVGADGATLTEVGEFAAQIAAMMIEENTDWRIVVLDLPHVAG